MPALNPSPTSVIVMVLAALALVAPGRPALADDNADLATVRARYRTWVLGGDAGTYGNPLAEQRLTAVVQAADTAMKRLKAVPLDEPAPALYSTERAGSDQKEVYFLVTSALPDLSTAYQLEGSATVANPWFRNPALKDQVLKVFDRLDRRGFRHPMHLPWKPQQVPQRDPKQALVVDFILRTSGYGFATFLMSDELRESGRLERSLATCWEIESHDEKTGDLRAPYLQADGIRVVLNLSLPAALAEGNVARLRHLRDQLRRSMQPESNVFDTIKPDGLGHHHLAAYLGGYASYTMAQAAFAAWLLQGTEYACTPDTVANVARGLEVLRVVSNRYDIHRALSGRLSSIDPITDVMLGYACLADLPHPLQKEFQGILARLADEDFMKSPLLAGVFAGHRDEVTPGPGAIAHFSRTLAAARLVGAEPDPQGHWSLNYGALAVHRRDDWMVSIKGYSRYWWAFERSLVDARKDARLENVLGFHDGSGSLMIFGQGKPWINARDSGYGQAGWEWCRVPGTTARYFTATQLLEIDQRASNYNRPYSDATFVGGVTLEDRQGLFVIDWTEATPDRRTAPLRALKSAFFFDDQIVMLGSGIRDGDGAHAVGTTLFQTALGDGRAPTQAQGETVTGIDAKERVFDRGAVRLVDAAGNGYFVPAGQRTVLTRREQVSLNSAGTKESRGAYATAWLDHGASPADAGYEYVILVRAGEQGLARFAQQAADEYEVRRKDAVAHIVRQKRLGITGFAIAKARAALGDALVREADVPCLVMARDTGGGAVVMSVANPDFGWQKGVQYAAKGKGPGADPMKPVPTPVTLTLAGGWTVQGAARGIVTVRQDDRTLITIPCADATSVGFTLSPAKP